MKEINIFCFGFGQVAKKFIEKINKEKIHLNLTTTSRKATGVKDFKNISYKSYQFSEDSFDEKMLNDLNKSDHILISISPVNGEDIVIKKLQNLLESSNAKWITYLSATSVYGDHNGEWVDEESKTNPTSSMGINRLEAENSWVNLSIKKNLPVQIFRLAGIYSNEKNILLRLKSGNEKIIDKKDHFFSRIHVEDIASVLFKSLENFKSKEIYNIADDRPASSKEVAFYGSKILEIKNPETIEVSAIDSEVLKNFYKDSKKVSNKKMKKFFDYELKYPSYVEGLNYILKNNI